MAAKHSWEQDVPASAPSKHSWEVPEVPLPPGQSCESLEGSDTEDAPEQGWGGECSDDEESPKERAAD
eukprot:15008595-Alexandrium_andersonii.AAC.1